MEGGEIICSLAVSPGKANSLQKPGSDLLMKENKCTRDGNPGNQKATRVIYVQSPCYLERFFPSRHGLCTIQDK